MNAFDTILPLLMAAFSVYIFISAFRLYHRHKYHCCDQNELLLVTLMISGVAGVVYYVAAAVAPQAFNVGLLRHGRDLFNVLIPLAFLNVIRHKFKRGEEKDHAAT